MRAALGSALHSERLLVKLSGPFGIAGGLREPGQIDQRPGLRLIVGRCGEGFFEQLDGGVGLILQYGNARQTVPRLGVFLGGCPAAQATSGRAVLASSRSKLAALQI